MLQGLWDYDVTRPTRPRRTRVLSLRALGKLPNEECRTVRRPRTRADCDRCPRPCPFVGCRYNLFLTVTRIGSIEFVFPCDTPEQRPPEQSCALDCAEQGPLTLDQVGTLLNVSRERARQIEEAALEHFEKKALANGLDLIVILQTFELCRVQESQGEEEE